MKLLTKLFGTASLAAAFTALASLVAFAEGEPAPTEGAGSGLLGMFLPIVLMIAVFYFLLIRPQKKREKEAKMMRDSIVVGDELVTIGGVVGKVTKVKDDEITIETGADKNRITFKKWAVNSVLTQKDTVASKSSKKDDDPDSYLDEYEEEIEGKKSKK